MLLFLLKAYSYTSSKQRKTWLLIRRPTQTYVWGNRISLQNHHKEERPLVVDSNVKGQIEHFCKQSRQQLLLLDLSKTNAFYRLPF